MDPRGLLVLTILQAGIARLLDPLDEATAVGENPVQRDSIPVDDRIRANERPSNLAEGGADCIVQRCLGSCSLSDDRDLDDLTRLDSGRTRPWATRRSAALQSIDELRALHHDSHSLSVHAGFLTGAAQLGRTLDEALRLRRDALLGNRVIDDDDLAPDKRANRLPKRLAQGVVERLLRRCPVARRRVL